MAGEFGLEAALVGGLGVGHAARTIDAGEWGAPAQDDVDRPVGGARSRVQMHSDELGVTP